MPQVKTRSKASVSTSALRKPTAADARELINKMMEYESVALQRKDNVKSGRFEMLTASERDYYRAELIADYIRLSAGNMGNTQGYFDAALTSFCSKICEMAVPSHELFGTYLAAVDIVGKEESLSDSSQLADAVRRTMILVLEACAERIQKHTAAT